MRSERWIEACLWLGAIVFLVLGTDFRALTAQGFRLHDKPSGAVRIVTWNIGGAVGGVPRNYDPADIETVVSTLSRLKPDLVFLQEIREWKLVQEILKRLGDGWWSVSKRGDCVVISARKDVVPRLRRGEFQNAVQAELDVQGLHTVMLGLHASAFDARARNQEIGAALDFLMHAQGDARILVGDLNLDIDLDKKSDLFTNDQQADVETYNYVVRSLTDAARGRGATAEPDRRLDYIFVSAELEVLVAGPYQGQRRGTMDHDPVVADVRRR